MRHITSDFKGAHASADARLLMGVSSKDTKDYLVVTGMDLHAPFNIARVTPANTLKIPLTLSLTVDAVLGKIASWMDEHDVLNQSAIHGHKLDEYNVGLYLLDYGGVGRVSLVNYFFLTDYVFDHCRGAEPPSDFNTLMWTLDRDKMAFDIRSSLKEDFGIPARRLTQYLWQRNMRACCHPDRAYQEARLSEDCAQGAAVSQAKTGLSRLNL